MYLVHACSWLTAELFRFVTCLEQRSATNGLFSDVFGLVIPPSTSSSCCGDVRSSQDSIHRNEQQFNAEHHAITLYLNIQWRCLSRPCGLLSSETASGANDDKKRLQQQLSLEIQHNMSSCPSGQPLFRSKMPCFTRRCPSPVLKNESWLYGSCEGPVQREPHGVKCHSRQAPCR